MVSRALAVLVVFAAIVSSSCASGLPTSHAAESESSVVTTERRRLRALVDADMELARTLHAEDFQLINPLGEVLNRAEYLDAVGTGRWDYTLWEPEEISVRLCGNAAVLRYRSMLQITVNGQQQPAQQHWHTDLYEKRGGQWQVVWSQATRVR